MNRTVALSDRSQLALERLSGSLCVELNVLASWRAWRSSYFDRAERNRRDAEIAGKHAAIRTIQRRLRRYA